jgi:hypothetical protein
MSDTPETDAIAEMAHNLVLDWDCRDRGDTTEKPVVVPAEFARRLERGRDNAISRFEALKEFCENELSWMYFRSAFLDSKAGSTSPTIENAQALQAYLKELK